MKDVPHAANLRWGRFSEPGAAYHITKCRDAACSLTLTDPPAAEAIVGSIDWHRRNQHAHLLAFVVMPDHVHWLFVLGEERSLDAVMHGFGSVTWQGFRRAYGAKVGKVWEDEYHEHRLRSEERAWATLEYMHENPVRKGLCEKAEEWVWSTANERFRGWIEREYIE